MNRKGPPYLVTIIILLSCAVTQGWSAPPEVSRIQGGNTKLIFGTGFDAASVAVHAWTPAVAWGRRPCTSPRE